MACCEELLSLVRDPSPRRPLAAIWDFAPCHASLVGGIPDLRSYYLDVNEKLSHQLHLADRFPKALVLPGVWPDLGVVVEASAFGGRITWFADGAPYVSPSLMQVAEIDRLKPPNPEDSGLMPLYLVQAEEMRKSLRGRGREMERIVITMGPAEVAGLLLGYKRYFLGMCDDPKRISTLMEMLTEFIIRWLHVQEAAMGQADLLILGDHVPSQVNPELVASLISPFIAAVFAAFPHAVKMYHNEGRHSDRHISLIQGFGFDVWHFGSDQHGLTELFSLLDERLVLFGGLDPHGVLRKGTPDEVTLETRKCLQAARGRRLLLSSGTGTTPDVPPENVKAMVDATTTCDDAHAWT